MATTKECGMCERMHKVMARKRHSFNVPRCVFPLHVLPLFFGDAVLCTRVRGFRGTKTCVPRLPNYRIYIVNSRDTTSKNAVPAGPLFFFLLLWEGVRARVPRESRSVFGTARARSAFLRLYLWPRSAPGSDFILVYKFYPDAREPSVKFYDAVILKSSSSYIAPR